jgi:glycine/D-amino acid oxidase-like deaminating enzyme
MMEWMEPQDARSRSLWLEQLDEPLLPRPALDGDRDVDVAIIGGGYTGLWTAHSLLSSDPSLRVLVVERSVVGFGASGRNGGWCIGQLAGGLAGAVGRHGRDGGVRMTRAIMDTVDVVGKVVADADIDCGFTKGGAVRIAGNGAQLARQRREVAMYREHGFGEDDIVALGLDGASQRLNAAKTLGGIHEVHAARVQPARLARGLAVAVERLGGAIVEETAVTEVVPGEPATVVTDHGRVRAEVVVRGTEAYTTQLPGSERDLVPLYALMVATEPLPDHAWGQIGLADHEVFADDRHLVIYGQRTTDGRIAFGARGVGYGYGSRIDPRRETSSSMHDEIVDVLYALLPVLHGVEITHRWGGVLAAPRDWQPAVVLDRPRGLAWAGGYVGEGVAAANLAGRTLAELITQPGANGELATLPWVGHRARRWEPEPLRWLGIRSALWAADRADRVEDRTDRASLLMAGVDRLLGR